METTGTKTITVEVTINSSVEKVWKFWTIPIHIMKWNNASDDWHTPYAENDLKAGGKFVYTMAAKDGSASFDFEGVYDVVKDNELIEYTLADDRKVSVKFKNKDSKTIITETFDAENINSVELQQQGWQSILNNFKKYTEASGKQERIHFEIFINARVDSVFKKMFDPESWKEWTSVFNPDSRFEGTWEKDSKMLFLGADKDGNIGGMVSKIREFIPNQFVSIEHLGIIQNGKEITSGPEVENWAGAFENYTFSEKNSQAQLSIEMDANEEFKSYFMETWPRALKRLKNICES